MMNAIELLKQDHEKVKKLLEEISDTTERAFKKRAELLSKIAMELEVHTTLEEEEEMFKTAQEIMSAEQLSTLGKQMGEKKVKLMKKAA